MHCEKYCIVLYYVLYCIVKCIVFCSPPPWRWSEDPAPQGTPHYAGDSRLCSVQGGLLTVGTPDPWLSLPRRDPKSPRPCCVGNSCRATGLELPGQEVREGDSGVGSIYQRY